MILYIGQKPFQSKAPITTKDEMQVRWLPASYFNPRLNLSGRVQITWPEAGAPNRIVVAEMPLEEAIRLNALLAHVVAGAFEKKKKRGKQK
jgi:hypothetical protein